MTGIVGYINPHGIKGDEAALIEKMLNTLRYTQKESVNIWNDKFISIARVSHGVINPESQPIFNENKSLFVVMQGEVFDYEASKRELIKKGHKFQLKNNDAEYCLHLYEEYKEKAFASLNGSFLILIYNTINHKLLLITDKLGWQPFYYCITKQGTLLFGTKLSSLIQSRDINKELELGAIQEFFAFQRVFGDKTFYKAISVSQPATISKFERGNLIHSSYWKMIYNPIYKSREEYIHKLTLALKNAVKRRVKRNYKFGILLGGGLDARAVFAASDKKLTSFTFGTSKNSEFKMGERVTKIKNSPHIFLKINQNYYTDIADEAADISDGMNSIIHANSLGFLRGVSKTSNVLMHGWSMDMFFRGIFLPRKNFKLLGKNLSLSKLDELSTEELPTKLLNNLSYGLFNKNPAQLFINKDHFNQRLEKTLRKILIHGTKEIENIYNKYDWVIISSLYRYPSFLNVSCIRPYVDEMMVAIDNDLLELYLRMPPAMRVDTTIWKGAMASLNKKIGHIPDAKTGFSPFLPYFFECIIVNTNKILNKIYSKLYKLQRSSSGFGDLIRYNKKLKEELARAIDRLDPSIFDIPHIREMFSLHLERKQDYNAFFFLLLTFDKWYKKYN